MDRYPDFLSGGKAQRVALMRAVITRRKIILCDEPTTGSLDPINASIVMNKLKEINDLYKTTIILVTHSDLFDNYFNKNFYVNDRKIQNDKH